MRARKIFTPVLMLTALDAVDERIEGLKIGADDYLSKPFDFEELVARINALVRRENGYRVTQAATKLSCEGIEYDTNSLIVTVDGVSVDLTTKEREILLLFFKNQNKVLSRERILNAVWGSQADPLTNIVDVYVGRLRKKLGSRGTTIQTARGSGYRFIV